VHEDLIQALFEFSSAIRYVAVGRGQEVVMGERPGLSSASSGESDRYEELLVNPTLVTLARQRGEIDCGGLRFLVVAYGNFHQLVIPMHEGHVSIAFELDGDPLGAFPTVLHLLAEHGLEPVRR
jgi:hypothetical protein